MFLSFVVVEHWSRFPPIEGVDLERYPDLPSRFQLEDRVCYLIIDRQR